MAKILFFIVGFILVSFMGLAAWFTVMWGFKGFAAAAGLFLAFLWSLLWLIKKGAASAFAMPFKAKAAVLHEAAVLVHSVVPTTEPDDDDDYEDDELDEDDDEYEPGYNDEDKDEDEDDEDDVPHDWYLVDVTITPERPTGEFTHWEPGDLVLVDMDAISGDLDTDDVGDVYDVEIWRRGRWQPDEVCKYQGELRLRLQVRVQQGLRRVRFGYYGEVFGELQLPAGNRTV